MTPASRRHSCRIPPVALVLAPLMLTSLVVASLVIAGFAPPGLTATAAAPTAVAPARAIPAVVATPGRTSTTVARAEARIAPARGSSSNPGASSPASPTSSGPSSTRPGSWSADPKAYPWLADARAKYPAPVGTLMSRFPAPDGFTRVVRDPRSFGGWLAALPLAAPGTPVVTHDGQIRYSADDPRVAAVIAIDVGTANLQQCADSVIRLHAEWSWSQGRRDQNYRAAAGNLLPYARFARGERLVAEGPKLTWRPGARASSGHEGFREYLNQVFTWANTVSLSREAQPVPPSEVRAGDFFVDPGNPGHTVLILDLARDSSGRTVALLGQSYMPAQSVYVLGGPSSGWFLLDPARPVDTPFWRPFGWDTLRRLDDGLP